MVIIDNISKIIKKSAALLCGHREEIREDTAAERDIAVAETVPEVSQDADLLTQQLEEKLLTLESSVEKVSTDLASAKTDLAQRVQVLGEKLQQLESDQAAYQKKANTRCLILSICGAVGIAAAVALAILL